MASADDQFSAPGVAQYESDTMSVGDGTWDFEKNTFLLPNLLGMNFETMRYNGMGNRFSSIKQYHIMVTAHAVLAALVFLFLVPGGVMVARFAHPTGYARRIHAYFQVLGMLILTASFILGMFCVGPQRSLTNPHHAIGITIYIMFLLQMVGGRLVKKIQKRSLRLMIHRWSGRTIALLGIAQIPLGLTLYGSPKAPFILFALWMAFLFVVYFILSWRHDARRFDDVAQHDVDHQSVHSRKSGHGWVKPLAAGAGLWAFMHHRNKNKERERSRSRSRSRLGPEVIPSRMGSHSYMDEKYSDRSEDHGGGLLNKLLGVVGAIGAGAAVKGIMDRRERRKYGDEEYSAVSTETPSRLSAPGGRYSRPPRLNDPYTESEFTEDRTNLGRRNTILGDPNPMPHRRPHTPPPSRPRPGVATESLMYSDYSSFVSPSARRHDEGPSSGAGKGILGAIGLGWIGKKIADRRDRREDDRLRMEEDERRNGRRDSRFTGDGYGTPTRPSRKRPPRHGPAPSGPTATTFTADTEASSLLEESRLGPESALSGPSTMPPLGASAPPPPPMPPGPPDQSSALVPPPPPGPVGAQSSRTNSRMTSRANSRADITAPVSMPSMPNDPSGIFAPLAPPAPSDSEADTYLSAAGKRPGRQSSARSRRSQSRSQSRGPVSVKVRYHDDRDRNVTLRRLTDEEAAAARGNSRQSRQRRSASISSLSGSETTGPGRRRYRRDSSARRTATIDTFSALSPPSPAFAKGRKQKDSAYFSGQQQAGPSGQNPYAAHTVSTLESAGTFSALSGSPPTQTGGGTTTGGESTIASAADRRRRRRMERRGSTSGGRGGTVDFT